MSISVSQIRRALADTILKGVDGPLYPYDLITENATLPAVLIEPAMSEFEVSMVRGMDILEFNLFVLVSRGDASSMQTVLDGFISGSGPSSIRRAIYDASDLGLGDNVEATVHSMRGYGGSLESYGVAHIGAVLQVRVHLSN